MKTKLKNSEEYVQLAHDINVKNQRNQYFYGVVNYLWIVPVLLLVYFIGIYYLSDKKTYRIEFAHGVVIGSMFSFIAIMFIKKVVIEQKKFTVDKDENLIQAKALEEWDMKKSDNEKKSFFQTLEEEERNLKSKLSSVEHQILQLKTNQKS